MEIWKKKKKKKNPKHKRKHSCARKGSGLQEWGEQSVEGRGGLGCVCEWSCLWERGVACLTPVCEWSCLWEWTWGCYLVWLVPSSPSYLRQVTFSPNAPPSCFGSWFEECGLYIKGIPARKTSINSWLSRKRAPEKSGTWNAPSHTTKRLKPCSGRGLNPPHVSAFLGYKRFRSWKKRATIRCFIFIF